MHSRQGADGVVHGVRIQGGKLDDISCLVAMVVEEDIPAPPQRERTSSTGGSGGSGDRLCSTGGSGGNGDRLCSKRELALCTCPAGVSAVTCAWS